MFRLFSSPSRPEISAEQQHYFENQFHWLWEQFGETIISKKPLTPTPADFPVTYDGSETSAWKTMEIICTQMDLDPTTVHLDFFSQGTRRINAGATSFFLRGGENERFAGGLYWGKAEDGKYHIWIESAHLRDPEKLAAVITHELAHVRLLGERRLHEEFDTDHELITEMFCVFCGMGVFMANAAFNIRHGSDGWSWQRSGYLRQQSWAYLLALYGFIHNDDDPGWALHLGKSLRKDFHTSLNWLMNSDAGKKFIDGKWKNEYPDMETINATGKWLKQSKYGAFYGAELEGKTMLTEIELADHDGHISGSGKDISGEGIQQAPIVIKGTMRRTAIHFELEYQYHDRVNEDGVITRRAERESYSVTYDGYFSVFLDAFIGVWEIRQRDPETGHYMISGKGTWEMKRK